MGLYKYKDKIMIKKYNKFLESKKETEFNLESAMAEIKKEYNKEKAALLFDDEVLEWIDEDWEEDGDYNDEYEWYIDHNNGEAQDVLYSSMANWYRDRHGISDADYLTLYEEIENYYSF